MVKKFHVFQDCRNFENVKKIGRQTRRWKPKPMSSS